MITVAELDDAIAAAPASEPIVSYQLERGAGGVHLRATATAPLATAPLAAALRMLYGDAIAVRVEPVVSLEPERSGKYARVRQRLALVAIPSNMVKTLLAKLTNRQKIVRGQLGVGIQDVTSP